MKCWECFLPTYIGFGFLEFACPHCTCVYSGKSYIINIRLIDSKLWVLLGQTLAPPYGQDE